MAKAKNTPPETIPPAQLAPLDTQQRYTIDEALKYYKTSRQSFYDKILPRISVIREGKRVYVPGSEIARLSRPETQAA
jgi:hypothetical protein